VDKKKTLLALSALAQETRIDAFRLLVKVGRGGMLAGEISDALGVRQNTMSAGLASLSRAGLIRSQREGRGIRYFADFDGMRGLIGYLLEDCCGGRPGQCEPLLDEICVNC